MNGYELLAIAVVEKAADDYRKLQRKYRQSRTGSEASAIRAIERFFRSDWGQMLSFGKGEVILAELKKECEAGEDNGRK